MRVLPFAQWALAALLLICCTPLLAKPQDIRTAAAEGDLDTILQLLKVDAALIDAADTEGRTPLIVAAAWGHTPIVDVLLTKGADVNLADKGGRTALHWAAGMGRTAIVDLLLTRKANVKALDRTGRTPRQLALDEKQLAVVKLIDDAATRTVAPAPDTGEGADRREQLAEALGLLGAARQITLSWAVVELSPEVLAAGRAETLEADARELNAKGLADSLLPLAKRKGKVKGLQYLLVAVAAHPAFAALQAKLGAPDGREQDEFRDTEQPDKPMTPVEWLKYGWVHFGVVNNQVRLVRVDCAAAAAMGEPQAGKVMMNQQDGADVVWVPAGEFPMGNDKGDGDEKPIHTVTLDGYWIYKYEVTVAQYRKFCEATNRQMPRPPQWGWIDSHPMVNVIYEDAQAYAKWAGGHLPTEAEWEKASRGTDGRKYPWGDDWDVKKLNCLDSGFRKPVPVGSYPAGASPYGVEDMLGNVYEWCQDWYLTTYYWNAPAKNPTGPDGPPPADKNYGINPSYCIRGGSFADEAANIRCPNRKPGAPQDRSDKRGFRVVIPGEAPAEK